MMIPLALFMAMAFIPNQPLKYPETRRESVVDTIHGVSISDPYRWLEDDRAPEVEAWVQQQGAVADLYLNTLESRGQFRTRLDELTNYERFSAPQRRNGITFFYKNSGKQNHAVMYMQRKGASQPEVLIDPNTFSEDGTIALKLADESTDARYLAVGKSAAGSDWTEITIMDISTKQYLPEKIEWVKASGVSWYKDGFFYSRYQQPQEGKTYTEKNSSQYICYHKLGTPQSMDVVVYRNDNEPDQFNGAYVPERSPYLVRTVRRGSNRGGETYIRLVDNPNDPWKKVWEHADHTFYPVWFHNGELYGTTELDAPNSRVIKLVDPLGKAEIVTVVAEQPNPMEQCSFGGGKMFVSRLRDVHSEVQIYTMDGKSVGFVNLPGKGTASGFWGFPEDTTVYFSYSSYAYPTTIFEYHVASNTSTVFKKVQATFNPDDFEVKQQFATSADGTKVPMFILHKKGLAYNGNNPTILYGYGGFGVSLNPSFNPGLIAWLERGGVYVVANLRGGSEYGEKWHEQGMKLQKQNVFNDAIACAEWLINAKVTEASRLGINGGSNGGLLVGAVINQRPDLFGAAVPEVGVMDMLRFHLFTIGWNWQADYGRVSDKQEFDALRAYSPYHNLRKGVEYPPTMICTADHDDRVVPAHSFKYAAMLQFVYRGNNPTLLRVERKSGHGAVNREKGLDTSADKFAFFWEHLR
jgi:prolyl oligopeptidase